MGAPSWRTAAKHNGVKSWNELIGKLNLAVYKNNSDRSTVRFKVRVHTDM